MPTPPSDKQPGPKRATIRARTRVNPVRPEVIDALDELERSLGDVARWEQLLSGKEPGPEWERPATETAPSGRHFGPHHMGAADADDDEEEFGTAAIALQAAIRNLDDRIEGIRNEAPGLARPSADSGSVPIITPPGPSDQADHPHPVMEPVQASPLLLQARTVEAGTRRSIAVSPEEEDEIDRRRRNGRMLTWVGLLLLVAVGAVFFLPDSDSGDPGDELPTTTIVVPTTVPFVTTPLLPTEGIATVPVVPIDEITTTTQRATTRTTKKPASPPVTSPPSTVPVTQPPLVTPGPTTPPTAPPTTTATTEPPVEETTTTAIVIETSE